MLSLPYGREYVPAYVEFVHFTRLVCTCWCCPADKYYTAVLLSLYWTRGKTTKPTELAAVAACRAAKLKRVLSEVSRKLFCGLGTLFAAGETFFPGVRFRCTWVHECSPRGERHTADIFYYHMIIDTTVVLIVVLVVQVQLSYDVTLLIDLQL